MCGASGELTTNTLSLGFLVLIKGKFSFQFFKKSTCVLLSAESLPMFVWADSSVFESELSASLSGYSKTLGLQGQSVPNAFHLKGNLKLSHGAWLQSSHLVIPTGAGQTLPLRRHLPMTPVTGAVEGRNEAGRRC